VRDNKIDLKEEGLKTMDWNKVQWRDLVATTMKIWVP
jgi:hypothetical protein